MTIDVSGILDNLLENLNIVKITTTIDSSGLNVETRIFLQIKGNIQSYTSGQEIELLKEGERAWIWKQLQVQDDSNYFFYVNDRLEYTDSDGTIEYKVMSKRNYQQYGYVKYILKQTFQD
jgi:hypothetical protein